MILYYYYDYIYLKLDNLFEQHARDLKVFEGVPLFIGLGESHDDNKH